MGVQFEAVISTASGGSVILSKVYDLIKEKSNRYKLQEVVPGTRVIDIFGNEVKLLGAVSVPCKIFSHCLRKRVTKDITFFVIESDATVDGVIGASDICGKMFDFIFSAGYRPARLPLRVKSKNEQQESSLDEMFVSQDHKAISTIMGTYHPIREITIVPTASDKYASMMEMDILNVPFTGALSTGSSGTILSSRIYDQIVRKSEFSNYRLQKAPFVKVSDVAGNEMKLLGALRIPCTFLSSCGSNRVVEEITFLIIEGATVDCIFGSPEISSCKISIILHQRLLVFNNHQPPIPIAIKADKKDSNDALEEEDGNFHAECSKTPIRRVLINIMTTTGTFPFMLKANVVGVPFQLVLSTGSSGTILSSRVYNQIVQKTKDPRYQLQKAEGIEVHDIAGNPMKVMGTLHTPCKFVCARKKFINVIEIITFLVVENSVFDGVFGMPEVLSLNASLILERGESRVIFKNYIPPTEIGIVERES